MTSEGHVLFSIASLIIAKKIQLTDKIINGDLFYMMLGVSFGALLPDIDHTSSKIGRSFSFFSFLISKIFGHRGFTHSFIAWLILVIFCYRFSYIYEKINDDILQAFLLGYLSHVIADMLTPHGVQFLWPLQKRFSLCVLKGKNKKYKERFISIIFIIFVYIISFDYDFNNFFQFKEIIKYIR